MNFKEVMAELKKNGTDQNIKIYRKHGAKGDLFGVSFANLNLLKKKIKTDHELAVKLWDSNNTDAQTLALMIADPANISSNEIDVWVKAIDYYLLSDMFAGFVAKTPFAQKKYQKWVKAKKEYVKSAGYSVVASMLKDKVFIPDTDAETLLQEIERDIHAAPNRARHSMNMALIAIGIYVPNLKETAIKTAKRIGKVEVDHGKTSCKTPDAVSYINKAYNRKKK